jgi:signal transduction histidine kinase
MAAAGKLAQKRRGGEGLHTIRLRLLLPVAVASIGLLTLGSVQVLSATRLAREAGAAAAASAVATATVRLAYQLEREVAEGDALRQRGGGAGASLLTAAREQTDLAVAEFDRAGQAAMRDTPGLRALLHEAEKQVAQLPKVRTAADQLAADQLSEAIYEDLNHNLLAVADAVPELITDAELAASARAVAALASAEHLAAEECDLLRGVFRRDAYLPGELATLASLHGAENERLAEFNRNATPAQRGTYTTLVSGDDVTTAARMLSAALAADRQPDELRADQDAWYTAQSNTLRRLHLLEVHISRALDHSARTDQAMAQTKAAVTGVSTVGLVLLAFGTALFLAIRTSRRLRGLRRAALTVAGEELPGTISAMTQAKDLRSVQEAMDSAAAEAESLVVAGSDEIAEVGAALTAVHRQALHLAAEQAGLRLDVAALFAALSRRGQTLIQRQSRLLTEFQRAETDPETLLRLSALDHLAARMRRNEENLLVLAGGEPGRRVLTPVPLVDVLRAAAAELEESDRVEAVGMTDVGVAAHAVRDVIHLLAELMENSAMFSPPNSRIRVSARRSVDSVTVSVFDEGIGMPASQVTELNTRLARPTMLTSELAGTMGLLVVGRLAARHGIIVEIRSSVTGGTVALVALPNSVLTPALAASGLVNAMLHPPGARAVPASPFAAPLPESVQQPNGAPDDSAALAPQSPALGIGHGRVRPCQESGQAGAQQGAVLPKRQTGSGRRSAVTTAEAVVPPPERRATPDPNTVRARLSGLAHGLTAGDRRAAPADDRPGRNGKNPQEGS